MSHTINITTNDRQAYNNLLKFIKKDKELNFTKTMSTQFDKLLTACYEEKMECIDKLLEEKNIIDDLEHMHTIYYNFLLEIKKVDILSKFVNYFDKFEKDKLNLLEYELLNGKNIGKKIYLLENTNLPIKKINQVKIIECCISLPNEIYKKILNKCHGNDILYTFICCSRNIKSRHDILKKIMDCSTQKANLELVLIELCHKKHPKTDDMIQTLIDAGADIKSCYESASEALNNTNPESKFFKFFGDMVREQKN